ncbi:hypothetical protein [Nocardia sp. NPDC047038]|uniref:hypothetical protein n=1 Tax=Nocardia sp. NPDC047038 TaxID=3154338 RepID=UPI00340361C8
MPFDVYVAEGPQANRILPSCPGTASLVAVSAARAGIDEASILAIGVMVERALSSAGSTADSGVGERWPDALGQGVVSGTAPYSPATDGVRYSCRLPGCQCPGRSDAVSQEGGQGQAWEGLHTR